MFLVFVLLFELVLDSTLCHNSLISGSRNMYRSFFIYRLGRLIFFLFIDFL